MSFVALVGLVIIVIILITLPQAELTLAVTPAQQTQTYEFYQSDPDQPLTLTPWQQELSGSGTYAVAKLDLEQIGRATGRIRITNNRPIDQTLVQTTRFLTTNDVLFRLDQQVVVPAGSSLQAQITADEPGQTGDLDAGVKLSIPGLSQGLQQLVFGETLEPFAGGVKQVGLLSEADLELARADLIAELSEQAQVRYLSQLLQAAANDSPDNIVQAPTLSSLAEVISQTTEPPLGSETDKFDYTLTLRVRGLAYNGPELERRIKRQARDGLSSSTKLLELSNMTVEVFDSSLPAEQTALGLRVTVTIASQLEQPSDIFEQYDIAQKTRRELTQYFAELPELDLVSVKLSPFWQRRVPSNPAQVDITLLDQVE